MSYNNINTERRRQGPALAQSMGRAGTGGVIAASGETAEVEANAECRMTNDECRSDDMVDDHDPLDAAAALAAADAMMRQMVVGDQVVALLRVARDEQQRPRVTPMALFGECPAELSFADFCTALVQLKAAGKVGYSEHHVWLTEKGGGL